MTDKKQERCAMAIQDPCNGMVQKMLLRPTSSVPVAMCDKHRDAYMARDIPFRGWSSKEIERWAKWREKKAGRQER